jgi:predicted DsbA family dithiol-disulfide isomerase
VDACATVAPMVSTLGGAPVLIRHFTDPSCPFAFSAERQRLRLQWLYGAQIEWELHMVVLSEERPGDETPPERVAATRREVQLRYGMPIDWRPVEAGASLPACRAIVATRLRAPDREPALLRRLRVLNFSALALDDPEVIERAASEALIDPEEIRIWITDPHVEPALRADMEAARSPSPASRAQDYKLGGPPEARRYTCPSYELVRATDPPEDWPTASRVDLPGFRPVEAYEAAIANLAPELTRRPDPESVEEVLRWAGMPVATAEVAAVCDRDIADVRAELARVATYLPVGGDGYWTAAA